MSKNSDGGKLSWKTRLFEFRGKTRWNPFKAVGNSFGILWDHRRAFFVLNLMYFLLVACGILFARFHRDVQRSVYADVDKQFTSGVLAPVGKSYAERKIGSAIVSTFAVNLVIGSLLYLTLSSLVIPFAGIGFGALRALTWGVLFSPLLSLTDGVAALLSGLLLMLMVLEGEAYLVAMFGCYVHGRAFLRPTSVGVTSHVQGYWWGLKRSLQLYWLVAAQLAIAAVYEAILAIVIMPRLH